MVPVLVANYRIMFWGNPRCSINHMVYHSTADIPLQLIGYSQTQWLINIFLSKTGHLWRCRPSRQRIGGVKRAASSCVRQCTGNQPFPSCGHWLEQPNSRSATNTWATDVLKQSELNIIPCLRYAHLHEVVEWKSDNLCRCLSESLKYLNNTIDKSIKQH